MATLASNSLNTLIGMGPDAMSNMFRIKISDDAFKNVVIRTTKVILPTKSRKTMDLPYHNTKATIGTPFFSYKRQASFTLRIDDAYNAYALFKSCIGTNYTDQPSHRGANVGTISVEQLNGAELVIYTWKFYNCEIIAVGDNINLDYNSSNPETANVVFVFETMEDGQSLAAGAYKYYSPASLQAERITQGVAGEEELEEYNDYWDAYGKHMKRRDGQERVSGGGGINTAPEGFMFDDTTGKYVKPEELTAKPRTTGGGGVNTTPEGFIFEDGAYTVNRAYQEAQIARADYQSRSAPYVTPPVSPETVHEKAEREAAEARADYQSRS